MYLIHLLFLMVKRNFVFYPYINYLKIKLKIKQIIIALQENLMLPESGMKQPSVTSALTADNNINLKIP